MLLHPLPPPPRPLDFSSTLIPTSSSSISPLHLSKTTQLRENIRAILGNNGTGGVIEVKLVQAIEDYLPCLVAIFNSCQTDELVWKRDAWFVWYPLLSERGSAAKTAQGPFASTSILFELDHVLLLYSLALSNLAALQYVSVGSYEYDRTLSDVDRKAKETTLKRGVTFSRKAIAVVRWLIEDTTIVAVAARQDEQQARLQTSRRKLLQGVLALHQLPPTLISLRLLLSPKTCQIQSTQEYPPPLPKSHPSPSLLAKLYLDVPRLADEAKQNLAASAGLDSSSGGGASNSGSNLRKLLPTGSGSQPGKKLTSRFKGLGLGNRDGRKSKGDGGEEYNEEEEEDDLYRSPSNTGVSATSNPSYPANTSAPPTNQPVSKSLLRYLDSISSLGKSTAFYYLALAQGETSQQHGEAIVWLAMALTQLHSILDDSTRLEELVGKAERLKMDRHYNSKSEKDKDRSWQYKTEQKLRLAEQQQQQESTSNSLTSTTTTHALTHRLQSHTTHVIRSLRLSITHANEIYTRLNNSISFHKLPSQDELYARVPTARSVLGEDATADWKCPRPQFGPGAQRDGSEDEEGGTRGDVPGLIAGSEVARDEYVGKGAYY